MRHYQAIDMPNKHNSLDAGDVQDAVLVHKWLSLGAQSALLMLLRSLSCLGQHAASADKHGKTASLYAAVGQQALEQGLRAIWLS